MVKMKLRKRLGVALSLTLAASFCAFSHSYAGPTSNSLPVIKGMSGVNADYDNGSSFNPGNVNAAASHAAAEASNQLDLNVFNRVGEADFTSFNIGTGKTVNINGQQGSFFIGKVEAGGPVSSIHGALNSNIDTLLSNPNGILFGQGARINASNMTFSTLNYSGHTVDADGYLDTLNLDRSGLTPAAITLQKGAKINAKEARFITNKFIDNGATIGDANTELVMVLAADGVSFNYLPQETTMEVASITNSTEDSFIRTAKDSKITAEKVKIETYVDKELDSPEFRLINLEGVITSNSAVEGENGEIYIYAQNTDENANGAVYVGGKIQGNTNLTVELDDGEPNTNTGVPTNQKLIVNADIDIDKNAHIITKGSLQIGTRHYYYPYRYPYRPWYSINTGGYFYAKGHNTRVSSYINADGDITIGNRSGNLIVNGFAYTDKDYSAWSKGSIFLNARVTAKENIGLWSDYDIRVNNSLTANGDLTLSSKYGDILVGSIRPYYYRPYYFWPYPNQLKAKNIQIQAADGDIKIFSNLIADEDIWIRNGLDNRANEEDYVTDHDLIIRNFLISAGGDFFARSGNDLTISSNRINVGDFLDLGSHSGTFHVSHNFWPWVYPRYSYNYYCPPYRPYSLINAGRVRMWTHGNMQVYGNVTAKTDISLYSRNNLLMRGNYRTLSAPGQIRARAVNGSLSIYGNIHSADKIHLEANSGRLYRRGTLYSETGDITVIK